MSTTDSPLSGGSEAQPNPLGGGPNVVVDPKPIKSGAEPLRGDANTTPSGQPIAPVGLDKTNIKTVEPGARPTDTPPLGSQESQLHADPRAVDLVEEEKKAKDDAPVLPLRPGDVVQGPGDRKNRRPKDAELEAGKKEFNFDLTDEEQEALASQKFEVKDPPIDENAPKDEPADPRKVAEGRGIKFPKAEPAKA